MRTIEKVLDEMIGANWMVTQAQIMEIRAIHSGEKVSVNTRIREAYEAGRKHDRAALERILAGEPEKQGSRKEIYGMSREVCIGCWYNDGFGCTRSPVVTDDSEVCRCDREGEEGAGWTGLK